MWTVRDNHLTDRQSPGAKFPGSQESGSDLKSGAKATVRICQEPNPESGACARSQDQNQETGVKTRDLIRESKEASTKRSEASTYLFAQTEHFRLAFKGWSGWSLLFVASGDWLP